MRSLSVALVSRLALVAGLLLLGGGCSDDSSSARDQGGADGAARADATATDDGGAPRADAAATDSALGADARARDGAASGDTAPGTTDAAAGADSAPRADASAPRAAYPGQPPAGRVFWGAAVSGNGDPKPRHETPSGHALVIRRTFFQWKHRTGYMITTALNSPTGSWELEGEQLKTFWALLKDPRTIEWSSLP